MGWYIGITGYGIDTMISPSWNSTIQTTYIGISAFLFLTFVANYVAFNLVKKICAFLTKFSYAIFLCHHYIIYRVTERFDFSILKTYHSYLIFLLCVVIIVLVSMLIKYLTDHIAWKANKQEVEWLKKLKKY